MNYRGCVLVVLFAASSFTLLAQSVAPSALPFAASAAPSLSAVQQQKIGSGLLLKHIAQKRAEAALAGVNTANLRVAVALYSSHSPAMAEIAALELFGVRCLPASWIPPLDHHPLGFFIASVPVDKIADVLALSSVLKMDSAEGESVPENNLAAAAVKATLAWTSGWTGTGVKVAVIDSGLDYTLPKTELPDSLWYRNYGFYPDSVNNVVSNTVTGHGTHVTGTVLGKGGYSTSPVLNTGNGGGAYKGMAPDAKLVFLKIGRITTSNATDAAMIAAIKSAADTFNVRVINMSYGGWDAFHDGSGATSQATDYAYGKGVACFCSAGNEGANARHYSATVPANDSTGLIQVTVTGAGSNSTALFFNLVWADGAARNNLRLQYYDASHAVLDSVYYDATRESPRGTESQLSNYKYYVPSGSTTYYLRVKNLSAVSQFFHLYDAWGDGHVTFAQPDPQYTIGSPAFADHAMAVAAYTTRSVWTDYNDKSWTYGNTLDQIAPFSSRGPRIDGLQKPNITAPGSVVISIRDRDVYKSKSTLWIDDDGTKGGDAHYYVMQGTSMASPVAAGCAALLVQHTPAATPQQIYDAIMQKAVVDLATGPVPNTTWGYGKLDINEALTSPALPVQLASFTLTARDGSIVLSWNTAAEVNNYGFDIERKTIFTALPDSAASASVAWKKIGFAAGNGTTNAPCAYSFIDRTAAPARYAYRLKQIDRDGRFEYSPVIETVNEEIPLRYALGQNYPNPFNPSTSIQFTVAAKGPVSLTLYDVLGRQVAVLVQATLEPGSYLTEWNASHFSSGVYFYRLKAGSYSAVKKLLVQK
jgi:subtilisin family serine protease